MNQKIKIGENVCINSHITADPIGGDSRTILFAGVSGRIIIGDNVGISNSTIFSQSMISIEDDACIGGSCKIYDTDFHSIYPELRINGNINVPTSPVIIKRKAFIGGHSIILKGVTIGEGAVIGAGSVVTHSIPDYEVWAGNPAKFIKKTILEPMV